MKWAMESLQLANKEFEGDNTVYLFDDGPLTLVDTGMGTENARRDLRAELEDLGYAFGDIQVILPTHWHADHSGLAGRIHAAGDATVYAHPEDAGLVRRSGEIVNKYRSQSRTLLHRWRVPEAERTEILQFIESDNRLWDGRASVHTLEDGESIRIGERTFTAHHAPGHTAGHLGFSLELEGEEVLLCGDALLPHYTPNIGGSDIRLKNPVQANLDTLNDIAEAEFDTVLPGHRHPIDEPTHRAREIIDHSRTRTEQVFEALQHQGSTDVWTISKILFGQLEGVHIIHGTGEVQAHLTHLETDGRVRGEDGIYRIIE
jgi:glyoxylase-like metal-dependent hydrolase (beta-lactamase superfamily II)